MRKIAVSALLGAALLLGATDRASAAYALCLEPRAPSLSFIVKPSKPYCATSRDGCEQWEIESYKLDVKRYYDQLQEYLAQVDSYRKKAYEYAACMADLD